MGVLTTLGTAGHIDHGKTTLVRALTGIDTDRLPEEKRRGISIDLGFAHLTTPGGRRVGIVDVPGHEKFIKNMVAGVWGIRAFLLVIAADEGIMPQTREHRDILELLGVTRGIVVLTKVDLVEPDTLAVVRAEVQAWLQGSPFASSPIVGTAAGKPESINSLVFEIDRLLASLPDPGKAGLFRLPVDRSFSRRGHGTVVTGTVASGKLSVGATVELLPKGLTSRVRAMQAFEENVDEVSAGQRAALNLPDVSPHQVRRGDLLAEPGFFKTSQLVDVRLHLLEGLPRSASPLKTGTRVRLYIGTREVTGRLHLLEGREIAEGSSTLAQLRLESPVAAARGDRYLLRLYAPMITIGGGEILDPAPSKHRKATPAAEQLREIESSAPDEQVVRALASGRLPFHTARSLATELAQPEAEVARALQDAVGQALEKTGEHYYHRERIEGEVVRLSAAVDAHHVEHPTEPGIDRRTLAHATFPQFPVESFDLLLGIAGARREITVGQNLVRRPEWRPRATAKLEGSVKKVEQELAQAAELFLNIRSLEFEAKLMRHEFADMIKFMVVSKMAVKIGPDLLISKANFDRLLERALGALRARGKASTPELKEALGLSRKHLIPFLEHLDQTGVTARSGNDRLLKGPR